MPSAPGNPSLFLRPGRGGTRLGATLTGWCGICLTLGFGSIPFTYPAHGAVAVLWAFALTALGCAFGIALASIALGAASRTFRAASTPAGLPAFTVPRPGTLPAELALLETEMARMRSTLGAIYAMESDRAERLRASIMTDPVSGLENRSAFQLAFVNSIELNRDITSGTLVLLKVEGLDELKVKSGGEAVDVAVRLITACLSPDVEHRHWLRGRLSEGAFLIAIPGSSASSALVQANALVSAVRNELVSGFPDSHFACEAGAVYFEGKSPELTPLLAAVEAALTRARARSALVEFDIHQGGLNQAAPLWWAESLKTAFEKDHVRILGQKVLDLNTGGTRHLELLSRVFLPRSPELPAQQFMPVAAQHKLVPSFDLHVLRWVRRHAIGVADAMGSPRISVNLGAQSLASDAVLQAVEGLLASQVLACRLAFEVSEVALLDHPKGVSRLSDMVKASGAQWGIDHFGIGPEWKSHLPRFRPDYVKLSGGYVNELLGSETGRSCLSAISGTARALSITLYVTPVENPTVANLLWQLGIEGGQGAKLHAPVMLNTA